MNTSTTCGMCGGNCVERVITDTTTIRYEGKEYVVEALVPAIVCSECGEQFFDERAFASFRAALRSQLGLLQPGQVVRARGHRTQRQLSQATGIAHETLSRLENDKGIQSRSTDVLLRAYFAAPTLFGRDSCLSESAGRAKIQHMRSLSDRNDLKRRDSEVRQEPDKDSELTYSLAA